jgi:hypothetical protein
MPESLPVPLALPRPHNINRKCKNIDDYDTYAKLKVENFLIDKCAFLTLLNLLDFCFCFFFLRTCGQYSQTSTLILSHRGSVAVELVETSFIRMEK